MPCFFFDFRDDGGKFVPDDIGTAYQTLEMAKLDATIALLAHGGEILPGGETDEVAVRIRQDARVLCELVLRLSIDDRGVTLSNPPGSTPKPI